MTRTYKKNLQETPAQETTSEKIIRLNERIVTLTEKIEAQEERHKQVISELTSELTKMKEETLAIRQLINDTDTKITIETAKRDKEMIMLKSTQQEESYTRPNTVEMAMPTFSGNANEHPKNFLKDLSSYMTYKKVTPADKIILIENCMRGNAAKWFNMIKDATPTEDTFKTLFLKHYFSEDKQWDIFIRCTEAGKKPISSNFQEHFHYWMAELKYLILRQKWTRHRPSTL